jgi:hypothetical protein
MTIDRKAAILAYKERKAVAGIYAVRCRASGQVWVGQTTDLEKIENRLGFSLRQGGHPCASLQSAFAVHGAENLSFDICERLEEEPVAFPRSAQLKDRSLHWRSTLQAEAI